MKIKKNVWGGRFGGGVVKIKKNKNWGEGGWVGGGGSGWGGGSGLM